MDLHDRVALITGASGGLGAVTARLLAGHGVNIAVTHLGHRDEAADLCRQIKAKGRKAFLVHLDQTDPASCWLRLNDYNTKAYVVVPPLRFEPQSKC